MFIFASWNKNKTGFTKHWRQNSCLEVNAIDYYSAAITASNSGGTSLKILAIEGWGKGLWFSPGAS